ncbi:hypothetical protein OH492_08855 [Vibrio chagasii]|nr:hypothetical protein [Vibrio chagasii]
MNDAQGKSLSTWTKWAHLTHRIWDTEQYNNIVEKLKRRFPSVPCQRYFPDADILLNKERMPEREALARDNELPLDALMSLSRTYLDIAAKITGAGCTERQS